MLELPRIYLTTLNKFLCKFSVYRFHIEYPFFISVILTLDFTSFLLTVHYVLKEKYKEYLDFCDVDPSKLLKHSSTRWLSLEKCVKRLLHHWPALTSYFNSNSDVEKPGRVRRVSELLRSHEMRMTFHFLGYVLESLNEFNITFQVYKLES